jgi:hypothetical protein
MSREHIFMKNLFVYDLPKNKPDLDGCCFDDIKGYWKNTGTNKPCIEDASFSAPRTKKADIETGEDKKGE